MGNCVYVDKKPIKEGVEHFKPMGKKIKPMEDEVNLFFTSCSEGDKIRINLSDEGELAFIASNPILPASMGKKSSIVLGDTRKIKFVLTKKELAQILSSHGIKEFGSVFAFRVTGSNQAEQNWFPALVAIPE